MFLIEVWLWLLCSTLAFWLLIREAIKDFGCVTNGGAVVLLVLSLLGPLALVMAAVLLTVRMAQHAKGWWAKQLFPRTDKHG